MIQVPWRLLAFSEAGPALLSRTPHRTSSCSQHVIDADAPSAARVVYDHFGGAERLPEGSTELMRAVDRADSASYSLEEILEPTGWTLPNFLMDSRAGLGAPGCRRRRRRRGRGSSAFLRVGACG
jgi:hypothetical protein